ncbi:formate/nitrite transporter family protein [Clostridium algidicarnis]|uniref:formate/nitrite transporter family protein n=1 Tax=Clostridium algidicarnis TaxID=37659 RepID=UPI001C0C30DB|nr:formate/nitrite transporter family protein [Clostridium algidicarnis]MBU3227718.1 formate/nitrite transporter family protein [Clostridium algidicarnis]MBU3251470.1 formate/nitrite transporter family protein [Clostridium algidicarnis]
MFSEEINKVSEVAEGKSHLLKKNGIGYILSATLAGLYIGFGVMLIFTIGGSLSEVSSPTTKIVMGASFGVALSLVIFAGAELFTGNNFVMTIGVLKKTVTLGEAIKVWVASFFGNLIGGIIGAYLFYAAGLATGPVGRFIESASISKMSQSPHELIVRGILCNMLVCLAVWCTFRMKEETGKLIMIFWCLFVFITAGFEHSVANMTILSIGLLIPHGAAVTFSGFIYNLGFVTLGNFIGGALFLALPYYLISKK